MENKNLHRLAELGLQCIADSHDINSNLYKIADVAKEHKLKDVLQYVENIKLAMNALSMIKYQKEKGAVITEFSLLDISNRVKKYFGTYFEIEIDCKKDTMVKTSKIAVLQSLINLVDNAIHFSVENNNKKKWCKITIDENSLTVSDNGLGVSDEIKEQIFEMYFTTKDISRKGCSTGGLGLYALKEHLNNIGWKICVENNTILKGANFQITF